MSILSRPMLLPVFDPYGPVGPKAHSHVSGRIERSAAASLCYWVRLHSSKRQTGHSAKRAEVSVHHVVHDKQIEPPSRKCSFAWYALHMQTCCEHACSQYKVH